MPARSQAQRAYLNARFGHDWVKKHGFDNTGRLPKHSAKKNKARDQMIARFQRKHGGGRGRS